MKRSIIAAALASVPTTVFAADPDLPGSHPTVRESYDLGDTAFVPTNFNGAPVELAGAIWRPTDLETGPFPLVVVLHGRHSSCFDPDIPTNFDPFANSSTEWPCYPNHEPVPSLDGYDYWAENLASHGYIVVSIGANGINSADDAVDDGGADARAQLIAAHLELWTAFNETAEYGTTYNDAVDLETVGLVGHSRGGEGVAAYFTHAEANGLSYGVRAALLLAPVDFARRVVDNVALAVVLPYCDGDVFDLDGAHYFDDSRYAVAADLAPKYIFEMGGSNHNFYNTIWSPGTYDDGGAVDDFAYLASLIGQNDGACGGDSPLRLSEAEQQQSFVAYANAFFRTHLGNETEYVDLLRGDEAPPAGAAAASVRTSYMPPDLLVDRLVVNRVTNDGSLATNDLGGAVAADALSTYALCGVGPDGSSENYTHCVADPGMFMGDLFEGREPHAPGLAQLRLGFAGDARWTNELPAGTDVSGYTALQFRAGVDFQDPAANGSSVEFGVALVDVAGTRATVGARTWSAPIVPPAGNLYPIVPKLLMHGVRIPLAEFTLGTPSIDLTDLAAVELVFDGGSGAIILSDLVFADDLPLPPSSTSSSGDSGMVDSSGEGESTTADPSTTTGPATTTTNADASDDGTAAGSSESGTAGQGGSDDGCGCAQSPSRPSVALFALLAFGLRRRRPSPSRPSQLRA